ncbi:rho-related GTP-binding protein RhoD isoform X1 [Ochotona curzoniae]|uniref:rho-related GTP-binding protein RhoD isoform X1 n=1 Tax=Ochotona curzoniae TaxID=130825 RepID=UPI001B34B0BA|nr:rho-related GTP-binding protein RhoD isoform X1 [Ochotona curzoniae]
MKAAPAGGEEAPPGARSVKVVLVGDGGCGKTSLLLVFTQGDFPENYSPTVFERYSASRQMKGKAVHLQIWDTAGQDDYDRLRPLFYPDANVLLLCFDVTSPSSFDNVFSRWYPEVTHFCKQVPIIVVGCKTDLRKDRSLVNRLRKSGAEPVTYHRGQEMARSVGAVAYLECSARLHDNVDAVFQEAVDVALSSRSRNFWRRLTQSFCVVI